MAIDSPVSALDRPFDYSIPERLIGRVGVGSVVRVMLHGRGMRAFVTELLDEPAVADTRPLRSLVSPDPLFAPSEVALARWAARRYVVPIGLVLHDAVPGRFSAPASKAGQAAPPITTPADTPAPRWLTAPRPVGDGGNICAFPPTVREEPELVAHLAGQVSGQVLIVCPRVEIAESVAGLIADASVLHGAERPSDRAAVWAGAGEGRIRVAIGGRTALFAPMPNLARVIVVSAHDRSLKSERAPRLHALVVARERARSADASFVVTSPAPPLEIAAETDDWIGARRSGVKPQVARPRESPVTPRLLDVVSSTVEAGRTALVFAGRKGEALRLRCRDCGKTPSCASCRAGLALTTVDGAKRLACRVCGTGAPVPDTCPNCGGGLIERGWGHERIAAAIEKALKRDVVRLVAGTEAPRTKPGSIVVGTLAAAHAIHDAGSICVADLDQALMRPDFRAAEHAVQILHELAGALAPDGRFLVQTREPEHHAVQSFTRGSYRYFADRELEFRKETGYPPFGVVVRVELASQAMGDLEDAARSGRATVIGTVRRGASLRALVRGPELEPLLDPLRALVRRHARTRIDVDPTDVI